MQLIYRWDIGSQILDAALQQIKQFLADPGELEKEENVSMCVAVKRRKVEPSKKRSKKRSKKSEETEMTTELRVSLTQSLAVLQAIMNDSIRQSAAYMPDVLVRIQSVLSPVFKSLEAYAFSQETASSPASNVLQTFFGLISLLLQTDTYLSVSSLLEANTDPAQNVKLGAIPSSMQELRQLLSKQLLTFTPLGSGLYEESSIGHFQLSLLHLLFSYGQKGASMLLLDDEVPMSAFSEI